MTIKIFSLGAGLVVLFVTPWIGCGARPEGAKSSDRTLSSDGSQLPRCDVLQGGAINTGKLPQQCAKIEGGQIGQPGIAITFSGISVSYTSWIAKDGEAGEFVGFTYRSSEPICVSIKAGTARFVATEPGHWKHPAGTSGPKAKAISNIVMCVPDDAGDDDNDGGDDDCPCGDRTCGPDPVCGLSCGTCPEGKVCIPLGFCAIVAPN